MRETKEIERVTKRKSERGKKIQMRGNNDGERGERNKGD